MQSFMGNVRKMETTNVVITDIRISDVFKKGSRRLSFFVKCISFLKIYANIIV